MVQCPRGWKGRGNPSLTGDNGIHPNKRGKANSDIGAGSFFASFSIYRKPDAIHASKRGTCVVWGQQAGGWHCQWWFLCWQCYQSSIIAYALLAIHISILLNWWNVLGVGRRLVACDCPSRLVICVMSRVTLSQMYGSLSKLMTTVSICCDSKQAKWCNAVTTKHKNNRPIWTCCDPSLPLCTWVLNSWNLRTD